jgi:hypothetical protein
MKWGQNHPSDWIHPVGSKQFGEVVLGQTLSFKHLGDSSKDCLVEVIDKSADYEKLKEIKMFGPFSAEAKFPWVAYSPTYLVRVKRL